ncbi:RimJ/RimL family protein N-acetyltransferase [Photobacterium frigidiphilum]|uniref:RimJ/RimL family protein N-acetyltransferase n=1 Tax=Photobacterium frigidiphilum TaxID=264736 RepID=A0A2T3JJM2_9GAMM|nr:GNAT family protein [Photobacterium frigidiphilum]PSU49202.1 RimJ/RimL family protein N-acetyltransferase [Photobacterium frigidiphilum]
MFTVTVDKDIKLCLLHPSFAPRYVELAQENHDYLSQWLSWPYFCKTEAEFNAFIQHSLHNYADNKSMNCAIEYKGSIVGNMGFNTINHDTKKVEIGYWLAADMQGKGIITRSCQYLIDYAFSHLNMNKVEISAAVDNAASRAVCERLGMELEGVITNAEKVGDRILSHAIYGLHRQ